MIKHFLTGFFIGSFLYFKPFLTIPTLAAITLFYLCKVIYAYMKSGELDL